MILVHLDAKESVGLQGLLEVQETKGTLEKMAQLVLMALQVLQEQRDKEGLLVCQVSEVKEECLVFQGHLVLQENKVHLVPQVTKVPRVLSANQVPKVLLEIQVQMDMLDQMALQVVMAS